ncbi:hypothetical protein PC129_g3544 [Phytophthora cactorum]|uniref:Uncharacterized protein n=1 Tax=Phytophthora cactorum TaxID=29920 RepID=A0A8T0YGQ7_9STRA|nr:hypothetical protein PC113_g18242 [Phytophthora cactorum]KAG2877553.1 hypothetical protein PC114_g23566 [Phytophthora cactorum]KAG2881577.1 hypothetical protein PC115_g22186 [Phytophthora cactorum]KAG2904182.1 hypothetical protein PC117_g21102 [Phytophthora cactorum]KAG2967255.1 hypothetical protein PC119_g24520 [Phytophthora cactorum]
MKGRGTWIRESCAPPARQLPSRHHVRSRASSHAVAGDQLRGAASGAASGAVVAGEDQLLHVRSRASSHAVAGDQLLGERQRRRRGGEDRSLTPRSPTGVESSLETSYLEHARLAEPSSLSRPASEARPSRHRGEKTSFWSTSESSSRWRRPPTRARPSRLPLAVVASLETTFPNHVLLSSRRSGTCVRVVVAECGEDPLEHV